MYAPVMQRLNIVTGIILFLFINVAAVHAAPAPCNRLSVYLETSPEYAKGGTVEGGSARMLSLMFRAGCKPESVRTITFVHEGDGNMKDITGVYVVLDRKILTKKVAIDPASRTVTVRFDPLLVVPADQMVQVDIMADFSLNTDTGSHSLMVELQSDIILDALDAAGTFPMRGAQFRTGVWDFHACYRTASAVATSRDRAKARRSCREVRREQVLIRK